MKLPQGDSITLLVCCMHRGHSFLPQYFQVQFSLRDDGKRSLFRSWQFFLRFYIGGPFFDETGISWGTSARTKLGTAVLIQFLLCLSVVVVSTVGLGKSLQFCLFAILVSHLLERSQKLDLRHKLENE